MCQLIVYLLITVQNNKRCSVHVLKQLHNLPIMQDKTSLTSPRKNKHKKMYIFITKYHLHFIVMY